MRNCILFSEVDFFYINTETNNGVNIAKKYKVLSRARTWIPSRTRIRCGDGNHLQQSASCQLSTKLRKVKGIFIRLIVSIDWIDCSPESFFITTELTLQEFLLYQVEVNILLWQVSLALILETCIFPYE